MTDTELSDQVLLGKYCAGGRYAFDALYRRYASRVHATAYRMTGRWEDAEDARRRKQNGRRKD